MKGKLKGPGCNCLQSQISPPSVLTLSTPPLLPLRLYHHSLLFLFLPPYSHAILLRKVFVIYPLIFSPIPLFSQSLHPFRSSLLHFSAHLSTFNCLPTQPISGAIVRFTTLSTTSPHWTILQLFGALHCSRWGNNKALNVGLPTLCNLLTFFVQPCFNQVAHFPNPGTS